ncbi:MAG TPA: MMPL family transporter [Rhizomicrobium sp.]|nr:MMPL family transporter [Rhizomicrobium sp.]
MFRPLSIPVIERIVTFSCRWKGLMILASLLLALGAGFYTATHFAMNTNSGKLISADVGWRKRQDSFDRLFPQQSDLILVVVDGATPELAEAGAGALTARLSQNKALFLDVSRPDGGPFFDHNGMLFLPLKDVQATTQQLFKAQPFLGALAGDPSLRGVMDSLSTVLLGIAHGQAKLSDMDQPMAQFGQVLAAAAQGRTDYLSWRALITGAKPRREEIRRFIEVKPRLFYDQLEPGLRASDAIRAASVQLGLTQAHGVQVRLTGDVPLSDEEFGTLTDRVWLMISAMMAGVLATLWLALRSFKIIFAILVTLFAGLSITMGLGLFFVGVFNIISIAFIALFVGLGVDFGIQFSVRYRAERFHYPALADALCHTGRSVGMPLALAAAATAVGFFSFLPTNYTGVAELGFVAGLGMVVAFAASITLLPALLMSLAPEGEARDVGFTALAPVDHFLARHRMTILRIAAASGVVCLALTLFLRFDSNPLDLRSRHVESVSTLFDLMGNPETSPNTINVLAPSLALANPLAARLAKLPSVAQALTVSSFVPDDQDQKLALIADANGVLDSTLNPFEMKPPPSDADLVASFKATAAKLSQAADGTNDPASAHARALASALEALANGPKANRDRATDAVVPGLKTMLRQLSDSLTPTRVSLETLPAAMKREWIAPGGTARIQVFPKNISNDPQILSDFSDAVLKIAPGATGAPIAIRESGRTIVSAFVEAGILSFFAILVLLVVVLRRAADVAMTLAPLILAGLLTVGTCVALGLELNFANIIALPLLLGIGVAFNIYFVVAWRAGARNFLQSSLTRAVIFSAATTASSFGTLWLSRHPGTASMGELLMISLFWTLVTTLFVSPALLGPPPPDTEQAHHKII